jgi:hypothetical protein
VHNSAPGPNREKTTNTHPVTFLREATRPAILLDAVQIFPRDPEFQPKAGRILDLYARCWQGQRLRGDEFVLSTDEKTSIQARIRMHPSLRPQPNQPMRVEHEYRRGGAWTYLAALDVHRAKVFGRCEATTGIAPFERLVEQVMRQWPYNQARRVFWIMDNGSSHRGAVSVRRLTQAYPRLVPVHGPVHASWLNQIEIYFSIVQRKVLTPNDFPDLPAVERVAQPFVERIVARALGARPTAAHRPDWMLTFRYSRDSATSPVPSNLIPPPQSVCSAIQTAASSQSARPPALSCRQSPLSSQQAAFP